MKTYTLEELKAAQAAQAPDFGEPWELLDHLQHRGVSNRHGQIVAKEQDKQRCLTCVNALAGVPDPDEFVRQAKENAEILKRLGHY
jgi:hypothetical protein